MNEVRGFSEKMNDVVAQVTEDLKLVPGNAPLKEKAAVVLSAAKSAWAFGLRPKNSLAQANKELRMNREQRRASERRAQKQSKIKQGGSK